MMKHYRNITGRLFFLNEIGRKVYADEQKIHKFTEEDVNQTPMLIELIQKGGLIEVPEGDVVQKSFIDSKLPQSGERGYFPSGDLAEPIGNPQNSVSVNPQGMSRLRDYAEPPQEPDLAVDPSKMSRYAETMASLGRNQPPNNFVPNAVNNGTQKTASIGQSTTFPSPMPPSMAIPYPAIPVEDQKPLIDQATSPEVWWCGPANDAGGYGRMNRECVEGLFKKGVKVELDLFKIPDFRSSVPITDSMREMMETRVSGNAPSVWAVMPQRFMNRPGKKIIFTMIETSEVQGNFLEKCKMADEIWVPSRANIEAFEKADTGDLEIVHMPLGVNTDFYKPMELTDEQKEIFNITTKSFVFLSVFGWSLRKGNDVLLKAYLQKFTGDDDVSLVIASRKDGSTSVEKINEIREDIRKYIKDWCPNPENPPHIIHIGDAMAEETLPILYNMAHCFVLPSRGEGFGLPYAEAGASEIPVIATRCGGQLDFLTDENSYLIDIEGYSIANQEIKCLSSYYEDAPFAVIGQKSVVQLQEYMGYVIENYAEAKEKAGILRKDLESNFTWEHLINRVNERIRSF